MAMFPASWDGTLETHPMLMDWEMKLHEEAAQTPMVSASVLSTRHQAIPLAFSAFSTARTRRILAKASQNCKVYFILFQGKVSIT